MNAQAQSQEIFASTMYEDFGAVLAGKRFALMGFDAAEAESIIAALAEVRAFGQRVGASPNIPRLNSIAHFDACIVNASAPPGANGLSPLEQIMKTSKPAILIGTTDELRNHHAQLNDSRRDFAIRPYLSLELALRAYRILKMAERTTESLQSPAQPEGRRTAVLADDDQVTIALIATILKHFDFECREANSGSAALELVRERKPDLVLLDISMPEMSGFEALTALRNDPATRDIPIVMVTSHRDEAELVKGFALGADDYVTKPFNSGELMARINRLLRYRE